MNYQNKYSFYVAVSLFLLCFTSCMYGNLTAGPPPSDDVQVFLAGEIELARLVDLCAEQLNYNIDYDTSVLKGNVTLRLGGGITNDELWELTNRVLGLRGFTSIRTPGGIEGQNTFSIVRVSDASGLSQINVTDTVDTLSGYSTIIVRIINRTVQEIIDAINPVMSDRGSHATALGDSGLLLISDLAHHVNQALILIEILDIAGDETQIERLTLQYQSATQLVTTITSISATKQLVDNRKIKGKVIVEPGEQAVLIVAPESEVAYWRGLVKQFDVMPEVETRTYVPRYFNIEDVANLIEQVVQQQPLIGSSNSSSNNQSWKLVRDELTGTLIITASALQHEIIEKLLNRLNSVPAESRRPLQTFMIRNRSVGEVVEILENLISAGLFENADLQITSAANNNSDKIGDTKAESVSSNNNDTNQDTKDTFQYNNSLGGDHFGSTSSSTTSSLHITADTATNTLIAIGEPRLLKQLEQVINTLDVRQVQVMLEVLIVSLAESKTLDLGVELEKYELVGSDTLITLSSLFGLSSSSDVGGGSRSVSGNARGGTAVILSPGDFSVVVRALETLNDGRSLSIPKVLINNNEQAVLNSVVEEPFLSTNASDTVATTSFGGSSNAGTTVQVTPHIAAGDHLVVEYSISLSSFVGESTDSALPPPRQENSLQSVATVPDGYIVALGGLNITTNAKAVNQVPLISGIPLIGELFKNRSISESSSRFYVFIRPTILRNTNFETLKYLSKDDMQTTGITGNEMSSKDWPEVEPQIIY